MASQTRLCVVVVNCKRGNGWMAAQVHIRVTTRSAVFIHRSRRTKPKNACFPDDSEKPIPFRRLFRTLLNPFGTFEDVENHFWDDLDTACFEHPSAVAAVRRGK